MISRPGLPAFLIPGINACTGNNLIAVVSRDQARADMPLPKSLARNMRTRATLPCCATRAVTVVAIETPSALPVEQAIAAAQTGKHVFCDKPMAMNVADAQRVVKTCEKAGVKLGVNFHNRRYCYKGG